MGGLIPFHEAIPDEDLDDIVAEFRRGWHLQKAAAEAQRVNLAKLNEQQHKHVDGLGQLSARFNLDSYHYWGQRLGYACWRDKGFVEKYMRDNPECRVNSKAENTTLLVQGTKGLFDANGRAIQ